MTFDWRPTGSPVTPDREEPHELGTLLQSQRDDVSPVYGLGRLGAGVVGAPARPAPHEREADGVDLCNAALGVHPLAARGRPDRGSLDAHRVVSRRGAPRRRRMPAGGGEAEHVPRHVRDDGHLFAALRADAGAGELTGFPSSAASGHRLLLGPRVGQRGVGARWLAPRGLASLGPLAGEGQRCVDDGRDFLARHGSVFPVAAAHAAARRSRHGFASDQGAGDAEAR